MYTVFLEFLNLKLRNAQPCTSLWNPVYLKKIIGNCWKMDLEKLPELVLEKLLEQCDLSSKLNLMLVSKRFYNLIGRNPRLCKLKLFFFCFEDFWFLAFQQAETSSWFWRMMEYHWLNSKISAECLAQSTSILSLSTTTISCKSINWFLALVLASPNWSFLVEASHKINCICFSVSSRMSWKQSSSRIWMSKSQNCWIRALVENWSSAKWRSLLWDRNLTKSIRIYSRTLLFWRISSSLTVLASSRERRNCRSLPLVLMTIAFLKMVI